MKRKIILQEACEDLPAYREAKKRVHEEQRRKEIAEAERVENEVHFKKNSICFFPKFWNPYAVVFLKTSLFYT